MGGPATFAGTNHQAGVIAFVFVHMLAHRRLGWLTPVDDTPSAVSAETFPAPFSPTSPRISPATRSSDTS